MSEFKVIKCPSCGSSVVEVEGESILKCSHCGSALVKQSNLFSQLLSVNSHIRALLTIVIVVMFIAGGLFYFTMKNTPVTTEFVEPQAILHTDITTAQKQIITKEVANKAIPVVGISKTVIAKKVAEKPTIDIKVINKTKGETITGGVFWIAKIRNDGNSVVSKPKVVVSLFNTDGRRLQEQVGWSKLEQLLPTEETVLLIFMPQKPTVEYREELTVMAKIPSKYDLRQDLVAVTDFIINGSGKSVTIVGDVENRNDFRVDFVQVVAVANDKNGNPVGIADAYATNTSLAANERSGFKITAGTFVAQSPSSWTLFAFGRKHAQ